MRLAIVADIHGNYRALEAVLADLHNQRVDEIISLGDNIGYGPEPEEVVKALLANQVRSVMGNHELALISQSYYNRLHGPARDSLNLTHALLSRSSLLWLQNLPPFLVQGQARFVHGSPPQSMTVYLFSPTDTRLQRLFASYPEQHCFAGHTHALGFYSWDGTRILREKVVEQPLTVGGHQRYLILPGSVGQPRDDISWQAKYMIWDTSHQSLQLRALDYDVRTTMRLLSELGFPSSNARRLYW